jgi:hypothetical protein
MRGPADGTDSTSPKAQAMAESATEKRDDGCADEQNHHRGWSATAQRCIRRWRAD